MIPKHKCTPYCDPDEGIHCLPNASNKYDEAVVLEDLQYHFAKIDLDVLEVKKELDITLPFLDKYYERDVKTGRLKANRVEGDIIGYLMWVRGKSWKPELNWTN